jgi:hypothetical protein
VTRRLAALWLLSALVALGLPLLADEAYYLDWSRHPALGYFDHPPGIALWVGAGLGHPRLLGVLLFPLTAWLLGRAAVAWGAAEANRFPELVLGTPIGLAGTALATPDAPLLPVVAGLLLALGRRRFGRVGLLLGVALWIKPTALLMLPALLLIARRNALRVLAPAVVVIAPHLGWSMMNDGLPYSFQAQRLGAGMNTPEFLLGQLAVVTPGLAWLSLRALKQATTGEPPGEDRALLLLAGSQLGIWLAASGVARVEANWPAFAWLPAILLLARRAPEGLATARTWALGLTAATGVGVVVAGSVLPPGLGPPRDPEALSACAPPEISPVAPRYQEAALLAAAGRRVPYIGLSGGRRSQYDRWGDRPVGPTCDYTYLAAPERLPMACPGPVEAIALCGRPATRCRCPGGLVR